MKVSFLLMPANILKKVKTQNVLLEEHIDKIVNTYRAYRHSEDANIDKFSNVATLDEIKENDYNLNIPRYVDTFEEEEPIDLTLVSQELKTLEKDITTTDKTIADFCKQLNIETPFLTRNPSLRGTKQSHELNN